MRGKGQKRRKSCRMESTDIDGGNKRQRDDGQEERLQLLEENRSDGPLQTACPGGRSRAKRDTSSSLGDILKTGDRLITASISENSRKAYRNAIRDFEAFRTRHNLPKLWPVSVSQVTFYIAGCFQEWYSPSSIRLYVAGLSFMHRLSGFPDPIRSFRVSKLLEGCKRLRPEEDARMPITYSMLVKMLSVLHMICSSEYELLLFRSVFYMAYFGLFRISEMVVCSAGSQYRALQKNNVVLEEDKMAVLISLRYTKTNQYGKPLVIRIPKSKETAEFIECIGDHIRQLPAKSSLFFCHKDASPLTRYQFSTILAKACSMAGLDSKNIKPHSFRIGRATDLSCQGYSDDQIKRLGRWSSDAFLRYIRI